MPPPPQPPTPIKAADDATPIPDGVVIEEGILKSIHGYTWPGIEYGEPPSPKYSFFEYIDALRCDDLDRFRAIEDAAGHWWHPDLDRGAGTALHLAVDAGALGAVKFLIGSRGAAVNGRDARPHGGWTPLHRAAVVAHHTHVPGLAVFEALLASGADPTATVTVEDGDEGGGWWWAGVGGVGGGGGGGGGGGSGAPKTTTTSPPRTRALTVLDLAVTKGYGWEPGAVRARLAAAIDAAAGVPRAPAVSPYTGPAVGPAAAALLAAWSALPPRYPPPAWRPPPPAGYLDAGGTRRGPWVPAGSAGDGSHYVRPMSEAEVAAAAAAAAAVEVGGGGV